jgi:hypothetical protein
MGDEKKLLKLYEDNLYPSFKTFWDIVQKKQLDVSYSAGQDFIEEQPITQIFKVKKHKNGNIVAYEPRQRVQIDIAVMDKFGKSNNGYKYILFFIDVFTRKGYGIPMKSKNIEATSKGLEEFCETQFSPEIINCDNDASFMGREFQRVVNEYNILFIENDVGNHRQLGIVDRFIATIKNNIYKYFKYYNTTNWIDALPRILNIYNGTPHSSLGGIKPENAHLHYNAMDILQHNLDETNENIDLVGTELQFKVGDKVRKKVKTFIKNRSYNPSYSTEVFTIEKINGSHIYLDGLIKPVSTDALQLVPADSIEGNDTALKEAIKADKVRRKLNEVGIDTKNVVVEKRERKIKKHFDE